MSEFDSSEKYWLNKVAGIPVRCMGLPIPDLTVHGKEKEFEDYAELFSSLVDIGKRASRILEDARHMLPPPEDDSEEAIRKGREFRETTIITLTPDDVEIFLSAPKILNSAIRKLINLHKEGNLSLEEHFNIRPYFEAMRSDDLETSFSKVVEYFSETCDKIEKFNETTLQPVLDQRQEQATRN